MRRNQLTVSVGTVSTALCSPSPKRRALIFNAPPIARELYTGGSVVAAAVDTAVLGVKLTYTAPAGRRAVVLTATCALTAGPAPTVQLRATIGGVTVILAQGVAPQTFTFSVPLAAGDSVSWNVSVVGAASTCDFEISAEEQQSQDRYTIAFGGAAVLDQGITVQPGGPILILDLNVCGCWMREGIFGISAVNAQNVTFTEVLDD